MKFNGHLFTTANPENPFSFKTDAVPIDPNRGKVMPTSFKKFEDTTVVFTTDQPGVADRMQQVRALHFTCARTHAQTQTHPLACGSKSSV